MAPSASKGEQLDALDSVIVKLRMGDRVIVTDSSRLDRRENLTSQVETMLAIRKTGAVIVSLAKGGETFANGDDLGSWVTTLVKQNANAEKSRTVKAQTYRGISMIRDNNAHHGPLPAFWAVQGERYAKQAYCADPEAVRDIYERVANGESLLSIARSYGLYPASVKNLIRFAANHTGVEECRYTYEGIAETWAHEVAPVIVSPLWWRANKVLAANMTDSRANKGGRPVAWPAAFVSPGVRHISGKHLVRAPPQRRNDYRGNLMCPCLGYTLIRVPAFLDPRVIRREPDKVLDRCRIQAVAARDRQQGLALGDTLVNVPDSFRVSAIR